MPVVLVSMQAARDTSFGPPKLVGPAVLLLLGLFLHWPSGAGFKADDFAAVAYASDWGRALSDWTGPQYDLRFFLFYRPVITTSLAVDFTLFGPEPFGFLLMNALACIAGALLLRAVAIEMWPGRGRLFGTLLAVLWLAQPILVPSLRWVVGRVDTHLVPLMLASVWFFLRSRRGGAMGPAWLLAVLALCTKETALGLPLLIVGLDLVHPRQPDRGPRLWGRRVPSLPFLLLVPAVFLFRSLVLGEFVGGYDAGARPGVVSGLWSTLTDGFVPGLGVLSDLIALVPILFVCYWLITPRGGSGWRIAGVLLISAGLWGPLAPVLPRMADPEQQRYAYLACAWMLVAWLGFAFTAGARSNPRAVGVGLLPLLWIVPGWFGADHRMQLHDQFNAATLDALDQGDRATADPAAPIVLNDRTGEAHDVYRLLWGLGVVMKPPFREASREVVSLRPLMPWVDGVDPAFFGDGIAGSVVVGEFGGEWVPTRGASGTTRVEPQGFDGVLRAADVDRLLVALRDRRVQTGEPFGYQTGDGYDGTVAVVSSIGSFVMAVPAVDGRLRVMDLLMANTVRDRDPEGGGGVMAVGSLWIAFDLAKHSPVYFYWRAADGLRRAELMPGPGLADALWQTIRDLVPR